MAEKGKSINITRNQNVIPFKNANSKMQCSEEDQNNYQSVNSLKLKQDNPIFIPKIPPKIQSNNSSTSELLNNIKRSIFVQVNDKDGHNKKYSTNILLTSPHVSEGLKSKYSQIYLETITQIIPTKQTNINSNIYSNTSVCDTITRKKEEILSLLNEHNSIPNHKTNRTCLTSMANSPTQRSKRQSNFFKDISIKVGLNQFNNTQTSKIKKHILAIQSHSKNKNDKLPIQKRYPISLTSANEEVLNKLNPLNDNKGKSNSIKIVKAQNNLEKMLNNNHKPITFSSNVLRKYQKKIEKKTQIKTDKEETKHFFNVLTIK